MEKAAFAALPPDSQQLVSALVENVKTSVSALVGRKVMLADAIVLVPILGLGPAAAVMATLDGWVSTPGTSDVAYKSMVNYAVLKASALLGRCKISEFISESLEAHLRTDLATKDRPMVLRISKSKKRPAAAEPDELSAKNDPALNGINAARAAAADPSGTLLVDAACVEALTLLEAGGRGSPELDALIETHRAAAAAARAEAARVAAEQERAEEAATERAAAERARVAQAAAQRARAERAAAERERVAQEAVKRARVERAASERARAERAQQQQHPESAKRDHSPQGSGKEDPLGQSGDEDDGATVKPSAMCARVQTKIFESALDFPVPGRTGKAQRKYIFTLSDDAKFLCLYSRRERVNAPLASPQPFSFWLRITGIQHKNKL